MKIPTHSLLPFLTIAAACGSSGPADTSKNTEAPGNQAYVLPSNDDILAKAYDSDYNVPVGFYVDERAETTRSYTIHHVLDESNSFEVCSDDLVDAQALESADNDLRAVNGYYVTSFENERYFEFVRELDYTQDVGNIGDITSPGYARVFKCNHTNRDGVDRTLLDGYSGRLDSERLDAATLREFTEYLWQFTFFETSQKTVLDSFGTEWNDKIDHTLVLAFAFNQGFDQCDRIEVVDWTFSADKSSGEVTKDFRFLFSIEARMVDGSTEQC